MKNLITALLAALALAIPCHAAGPDRNADAAWKTVENAMKNVKTVSERYSRVPERRMAASIAYDTAMKEFLAQAPNDARRWQAKLFEVDFYWVLGGPIPPVDIAQACDEILNAPGADAATKGEASGTKILRAWVDRNDGDFPVTEWAKMADSHLQTYPSCKRNPQIKASLVSARTLEAALAKPVDLKFIALDGSEVDFDKLRGKVVLIYFWSHYEAKTLAVLPQITGTYLRQHAKGFEVVGVSLDYNKPALKAFLRKEEMPWPQFFDGKGPEKNELVVRFGISRFPCLWLVDKKGMVVNRNASENLEAEVERLLAE